MLFQALYVEEEVLNHPITKRICKQYPNHPVIVCERYGEVFNKKGQNFRLQKQNPSLILAKKYSPFLLPTPEEYHIGGANNYYFSHLLNCPFDCRYCFLQGMYQSAHYVWFVNYEDFQSSIEKQLQENQNCDPSYFFSGYDCDSLALEPLTHFVEEFIPFFSRLPNAYLELRTKSTQIQTLLRTEPQKNVITAFSLSPETIVKSIEHKTPTLQRRLKAIQKLQEKGWPIGLRLDPLLYFSNFKEVYREFFELFFSKIKVESLHSVSLGPFRMPKNNFKKLEKLYPEEPLFAFSLENRDSMISYKEQIEEELISYCSNLLLNYIPEHLFFPCEVPCQKK